MKKIFILILLSFSLQSQAQDYHVVLPTGKGYFFSGTYPSVMWPAGWGGQTISEGGSYYPLRKFSIDTAQINPTTFRVVPVINQPRFYNIIRNSNGLLIGMYDANDKSLEFKRDVIRLHEIEELVEQVKRLNTE